LKLINILLDSKLVEQATQTMHRLERLSFQTKRWLERLSFTVLSRQHPD
jgi:hypothetical protein